MTEKDLALSLRDADPKPWWRSRGILGALAVIIAQIAALAGVTLDADLLTVALVDAAALVGGAAALWGRVRAEQPIRPLRRRKRA